MNAQKEALNAALNAVIRHNWLSAENREIIVREALAVAAPILQAEAWNDGYGLGYGDGYAVDGSPEDSTNPYSDASRRQREAA